MWGAYFCMGAYKRDVVVVIKTGAYKTHKISTHEYRLYSWCLFCVFYPDFTVYTLERHTC